MRKEVIAALSVIGVGSAIFLWVSRQHSTSSQTQGNGSTTVSQTGESAKKPEAAQLLGSDSKEQQKSEQKNSSQEGIASTSGGSKSPEAKSLAKGEGQTTATSAVKTEPEKKAPTCFQAEYQVPETDIPQILDLGKDLQLNAKTVCVRVNGSPVAFQFKEKAKNQIIIGSLHESKNDVKVSYCVGVSKCSDPCVVKQDRFLAALGGEDDLKATGKEDAALSAEEQDLEKELASFQALRLSKEQKVFSPKQVTASCQKDAS